MLEQVKQNLREELKKALKNSGVNESDIPEIGFESPKHIKFGDLSTNVALGISKKLKKNPRETAQELLGKLNFDKSVISKAELAGPGFINFFLSDAYLGDLIKKAAKGENFYSSDAGKSKKVNLEFVSANPVGPLNVVNARAAAVGNVIANLLNNSGFKTTKEFYVNNVGNQTNTFGKSISLRYQEALGKKIEFPEDGYGGEYVKDVAKAIIDKEGDKYLEKSEEERIAVFKPIGLSLMIEWQKKSLKDYGVEFDVWFFENVLHEKKELDKAFNILKEKGMIKEEEGAKWFTSSTVLDKEGKPLDDKDRVLIKSDGVPTYLLPDIAYHFSKISRGFEFIVDILGPDHHGYIGRISAAVKVGGLPLENFRVLIAQQVNLIKDGKPFKMSKRQGNFISMDELVEEVGADAAKYFFLRRSLDSHLDFDIDLAKKQTDENPVFYVQYAHARICNVIEYAKTSGFPEPDFASVNYNLLTAPEEAELLRKVASFGDTLNHSALNYAPHLVPKYLEELAGLYHSFYAKCRVVSDDKELTTARLVLCFGARNILRHGLGILGVSAPSHM
ncbi:MAG: arginine--tRNA ligase [Candidatus Firestonebacteria bacterium RIFOXYC2_FULL_39_67]|nr:MAG: arginine--tRNA ligase [Candidatus Firestonebacteria bacterium RIFOXYD2_FULL_39_29]OGF52848.1 MAG: arginine--tRNA ligase [Candidatus Firestonebacteria bacterium RifOxyC12_full_39_7]OGF57404.1 MAG: arginine--tRNA ligase [Candidatus Firestonebacteria bacterium RIFOXYC2_FULL_39_67]